MTHVTRPPTIPVRFRWWYDPEVEKVAAACSVCGREARFGVEELADPSLDHARWCSKVAILADVAGPTLWGRLWKWRRRIGNFCRLSSTLARAESAGRVGVSRDPGRPVAQISSMSSRASPNNEEPIYIDQLAHILKQTENEFLVNGFVAYCKIRHNTSPDEHPLVLDEKRWLAAFHACVIEQSEQSSGRLRCGPPIGLEQFVEAVRAVADLAEIERFAADITFMRELAPEVPLGRDFEE